MSLTLWGRGGQITALELEKEIDIKHGAINTKSQTDELLKRLYRIFYLYIILYYSAVIPLYLYIASRMVPRWQMNCLKRTGGLLSHKAGPVVIPNCANLGENKHNKTISQTD